MTIERARIFLVSSSLLITFAALGFFVTAPAFGYPLTFDEALRLLEIIVPVFLGYLGSASYFIFRAQNNQTKDPPAAVRNLLGLMVRGPLLVFAGVVLLAIIAFGYTNRVAAAPGVGMTTGTLAQIISVVLGLQACTTNVIVSYLFRGEAPENVS